MLARFGQLGLVELLEHAGLDLVGEEGSGRHHDVVACRAGEQLGLKHLVGIKDVVDDLDAGEFFQNGLIGEFGPGRLPRQDRGNSASNGSM
jgi:hypothetical protein